MGKIRNPLILVGGGNEDLTQMGILIDKLGEEIGTYSNYLTFKSSSSFSITIPQMSWDGALEYSTDKVTWTNLIDETITSNNSNELYMRGIRNTVIHQVSGESPTYWEFDGTDVSIFGNIEVLLDYQTVEAGNHPPMGTECFASLFQYWPILKGPEIGCQVVSDYCFWGMYLGCNKLRTLPKLYSITVDTGCYESMLAGCSQIKLSATQTGDYQTPYRIPVNGQISYEYEEDYVATMFEDTGGTYQGIDDYGTPALNTTLYTTNIVE